MIAHPSRLALVLPSPAVHAADAQTSKSLALSVLLPCQTLQAWCDRELAAENASLKAELLELRAAVTQHLAAHASSLPYAQSIALSQVRTNCDCTYTAAHTVCGASHNLWILQVQDDEGAHGLCSVTNTDSAVPVSCLPHVVRGGLIQRGSAQLQPHACKGFAKLPC